MKQRQQQAAASGAVTPNQQSLFALQETFASTTDPISQGIVAGILVAVFVLLALEAAHRVVVVLGAVGVVWLITYFTPFHLLSFEATREALDINVLVLLASMMALVGVFKTTGVFEWAVAHLLRGARGRVHVVVAHIIWFTAATSAFLDNVTTVIFVTPMAVGLARHLRLRPEALLLPMIMASNIGGTATLIGDPPNIMIGSGAHLSFLEFVRTLAVPCLVMLFWLIAFSRRYFRRDLADAAASASENGAVEIPALADPVLARWLLVIGALVLAGFLTHHLTGMPAAVPATVGAGAALIVQDRLYLRQHGPTPAERLHGILAVTERDIEWPTLSFFGFLFILVGAAVETGLIGTLATTLERGIEGGATAFGLSPLATLLFAALLICWISSTLSAFIDNIPFVAVAIPIIAQLTQALPGDTVVLWWALSLGACLGGNATLIGASANVTTVGLAEREGVRVSFGNFARFGVPITAGTLVISSIYLALYVYLGRGAALLAGAAASLLIMAVRALGTRGGHAAHAAS